MTQYLVLAEAVLEMKRIFAMHVVGTHEDGAASTVDCYLDAASANSETTSLRLEGQDAKAAWDNVMGRIDPATPSGSRLHLTRFHNWAFDVSRICVVRYGRSKVDLTFALGNKSYTLMVETLRAINEMRAFNWNQAITPALPVAVPLTAQIAN